jgi:hypothetical protein
MSRRQQTADEIEASIKGVNKFQDPEHTRQSERYSIGRRLVAANLGQLNIPEKPYSSSREYKEAYDKRMDEGTRRTTSALSYATSGYPVNRIADKKAVRGLNEHFSHTPKGIHNTERINHLRKEMLKRRDWEKQEESNSISREQQTVVDEIRRSRANEGSMSRRAEEKLKEGWGGGYKMGLLARIMNIKKKAAKSKAAKAKSTVRKAVKPTVRKPTKRPAKPTRPVVRRRKPTGVRK